MSNQKKNEENNSKIDKKNNSKPKTYEDYSDLIDQELSKRKKNWFLTSVAWVDFDDVCQIIRAHIYNKWNQWEQSRPIKPWINKIIANQMKNILRNHYSNYARPCLNCPFNSDSEYNLCSFTASGEQDCSCPLYKKWTKSKKNAYNIKITLSLENHINQIDTSSESVLSADIEIASKRLIQELRKQLNSRQFQAFDLLSLQTATMGSFGWKLPFLCNGANLCYNKQDFFISCLVSNSNKSVITFIWIIKFPDD